MQALWQSTVLEIFCLYVCGTLNIIVFLSHVKLKDWALSSSYWQRLWDQLKPRFKQDCNMLMQSLVSEPFCRYTSYYVIWCASWWCSLILNDMNDYVKDKSSRFMTVCIAFIKQIFFVFVFDVVVCDQPVEVRTCYKQVWSKMTCAWYSCVRAGNTFVN